MDRDDDFFAPFKIIQSRARLSDISEERKRTINESIVSDALGLDPVPVPDSGAPQHERDFLYSTLELYHSCGRFDDYETMLKHYPWRGKIRRKTHFAITVYCIVNEAYLFETRLKRFFNAVEDCADALQCEFPKQKASKIIKAYHRSFAGFLKARGIHTHHEVFEPRELQRIGLIELLSDPGGMVELKWTFPNAISEFRKIWLKNNSDAKDAIKMYMTISFSATNHIWSRLTDQS